MSTEPTTAGSGRTELTGWGRTAASSPVELVGPAGREELIAAAASPAPDRGQIGRGLGRSYNDAAQNAGGRVIDATGADRILHIDAEAGVVRAEAGVSIDQLLRVLVPLGWFVPVTPGTRSVTVGGAVAADIHGKNHHVDGSWCDHVRSVRLWTPAQGTVTVGPDTTDAAAELFWATAGGMGLTGVVAEATVSCTPIETSRLVVDTERCEDLDAVMAAMEARDHEYHYSVAWIDLLARGRQLGRSVLTRGRFARRDELDRRARANPLAHSAEVRLSAPPVVPNGLLNRWSIRAFNEAWFRKAPRRRVGELQSIAAFFHPLDGVAHWNRLYGPAGFTQWQCVVPFGRDGDAALAGIVERLSGAGVTSFLAVLKRFGRANPGPLSFPTPGWTLALDIPAAVPGLAALLDELDHMVVAVGGRVYLAKDARVDPALLGSMYPRLEEWRSVRDLVDPQRVMRSDLARRLGL